jgi:hypothetical protein
MSVLGLQDGAPAGEALPPRWKWWGHVCDFFTFVIWSAVSYRLRPLGSQDDNFRNLGDGGVQTLFNSDGQRRNRPARR